MRGSCTWTVLWIELRQVTLMTFLSLSPFHLRWEFGMIIGKLLYNLLFKWVTLLTLSIRHIQFFLLLNMQWQCQIWLVTYTSFNASITNYVFKLSSVSCDCVWQLWTSASFIIKSYRRSLGLICTVKNPYKIQFKSPILSQESWIQRERVGNR